MYITHSIGGANNILRKTTFIMCIEVHIFFSAILHVTIIFFAPIKLYTHYFIIIKSTIITAILYICHFAQIYTATILRRHLFSNGTKFISSTICNSFCQIRAIRRWQLCTSVEKFAFLVDKP